MPGLSLNPFGLLLAGTMSVTNVLTDVARKHALEKRDLVPVTFWIRVAVTFFFAIAFFVRMATGIVPAIRDGGVLFGIGSLHLPPVTTFVIYLVIDVCLITIVMWLYFRALQISPLSLCIPFLSFTPVFLLGTGFVMLGELPPAVKILGVVLIVVGSLVMHRRLFAQSLFAPVKAVIQEKGSRYMLMVSFIFAVTNPIEKRLVLMSDAFTQAFVYGLGLCLSFLLLTKLQKGDLRTAVRANIGWITLAGFLDAAALLLQFASYNYIDVVISVSIKRAGIILSVFSGWLFFHERGITDKVIAASVMFAGVLILYLPLTPAQTVAIVLGTLAAMAVALYSTRKEATS